MSTIIQLRKQRKDEFSKKQNALYTISGLIGRPSDLALQVSNRVGYVWVRIGNDESLAQAYCQKAVRYNMPCICELGSDGVFRIIRFRQDEYTAAGFEPIPEVDLHGTTHTWPDPSDPDTNRGSDPGIVDWRQILGLRIRITGTWTIQVDADLLFRNGTWGWVSTQNIDLETSVPETYGTRYSLIYLGTNNIVNRSDGPVSEFADSSSIPALLAGQTPLAVVMLWKGQSSLRDDAGRRDIQDVRFQGWVATSEGTEIPTETTQAVATTPRWFVDGPLAVVANAAGIWRIEQVFEVTAVTIYLYDTGTTGTTTIDVDYSPDSGANWTTLFPTQADRPSIAGGASSHVDTGTLAFATLLNVGTLLRVNIESAAVVARGLSVQLSGEEGTALIVPDMLMMGV